MVIFVPQSGDSKLLLHVKLEVCLSSCNMYFLTDTTQERDICAVQGSRSHHAKASVKAPFLLFTNRLPGASWRYYSCLGNIHPCLSVSCCNSTISTPVVTFSNHSRTLPPKLICLAFLIFQLAITHRFNSFHWLPISSQPISITYPYLEGHSPLCPCLRLFLITWDSSLCSHFSTQAFPKSENALVYVMLLPWRTLISSLHLLRGESNWAVVLNSPR